MGSHTNPTNCPFPAITQPLPFWRFPWDFIPFFASAGAGAASRASLGRGAGGSGEPPINANHFPYATRFCCRGHSALSGYRVPFCFHSLGLCDLSF